jgi:hypothetical protein
LRKLPRVIVGDRTIARDKERAAGAVVHPEPTLTDSVNFYQVMLCPKVAIELGWRPDSSNLFTYRNGKGDVMARTLHWRDGGERILEWDDSIHRYGYILLVRADQADRIRPYLSCAIGSRAWRTVQKDYQ